MSNLGKLKHAYLCYNPEFWATFGPNSTTDGRKLWLKHAHDLATQKHAIIRWGMTEFVVDDVASGWYPLMQDGGEGREKLEKLLRGLRPAQWKDFTIFGMEVDVLRALLAATFSDKLVTWQCNP